MTIVAVAFELTKAEADALREDLDCGARLINARITEAKAATDVTHWQRRKLMHQSLTAKLVVALHEAGL